MKCNFRGGTPGETPGDTIRQGMIRENIEELSILPEGRPTKTPTTARVLEMFSDVSWYEFQRGDETVSDPQ